MENKKYEFENKRIPYMGYMINLPEGYSEDKKYPLIVALHGAGERGDDLALVLVHGVAKYVAAGKKIDAVVIAPQCPKNMVWNALTVELKELIDHIVSSYSIDENKVAVTGLSMGGFGTWEMGISYPGFFSALAPVCGGGMSWRAPLIGKTPVWAFHGDVDTVVPKENSYMMVDALKAKGGNVRLTVFHGVGHNSWESAYEITNVIDWLISQDRRNNE